MNSIMSTDYKDWLKELKSTIQRSQIKAALAVNSQLMLLYWDMGRQIEEKQRNAKWGSGFINQLSKDLKAEFPQMGGFSVGNLRYCKLFYSFYKDNSIHAQALHELETGENQTGTICEQVVRKLETNKLVKDERDEPTIGILLCKNKDDFEVEFALKDVNNPIGVSEYHYKELPENIKKNLSTLKELAVELKSMTENEDR